jgi:hypothetical protein
MDDLDAGCAVSGHPAYSWLADGDVDAAREHLRRSTGLLV